MMHSTTRLDAINHSFYVLCNNAIQNPNNRTTFFNLNMNHHKFPCCCEFRCTYLKFLWDNAIFLVIRSLQKKRPFLSLYWYLNFWRLMADVYLKNKRQNIFLWISVFVLKPIIHFFYFIRSQDLATSPWRELPISSTCWSEP